MRLGSTVGSMNCERPGAIVRGTDTVCVPSRLLNCAVTFVGAPPRFWMMKVVSHPAAFFAA